MPILREMDPNRTVLPRDPPSIVRNTQKNTHSAPLSTFGDHENHVSSVFVPKLSQPRIVQSVKTVPSPANETLQQSLSVSPSESLHSYFRTDRQGRTASICLLCNSFGILDRIHHMKNSVRHSAFLSIVQRNALFDGPSYFSLPSIQIVDGCSSSDRSEGKNQNYVTICPYRWVTFHIRRNECGGTTLFAHLKVNSGGRFRCHDMVLPVSSSSQGAIDSNTGIPTGTSQRENEIDHFLPTADSANAMHPRSNHELNDSWFCSLCHVYGLTSNQFWMHCLTDDHTMKLTSLKKRKSSPTVTSDHPSRPVAEKFGRVSHGKPDVVPKDVVSPIKAVFSNDENQTPNRAKANVSQNASQVLDSSFSSLPSSIIVDEESKSCVAQVASALQLENAIQDDLSKSSEAKETATTTSKNSLFSPRQRILVPASDLASRNQSRSNEVTEPVSMLSAVSAFYEVDGAKTADDTTVDACSEDDSSVVTIATTSVTDDTMMKGRSMFVGCLASDLLEEENIEEGDECVEIVDETVDQGDYLVHDPLCPSCSMETTDREYVHSSVDNESVSHSLETPKCSNVDRDAMREPMSFFVTQNKDKVHWSCKLCGIFNLQEHSVNCHCLGRKHRLALEKALRNSFSPPKPDFVSLSPRKVLEERLSFQMALDDAARTDPRFVHIVYNDANATKSSWSCHLCNVHGLQMKDVEPHCLGKKHTTAFQKFTSLKDSATTPIRNDQSDVLGFVDTTAKLYVDMERRLSADMIHAIIEETESHIYEDGRCSRNISLCTSYYYDAINGEWIDDEGTVFHSFLDDGDSFFDVYDDSNDFVDLNGENSDGIFGHWNSPMPDAPNLSQLMGDEYLDELDNSMEEFCEQLRKDLEELSDIVLGKQTPIRESQKDHSTS